jgi:hypothetical protein
MAIHKTIGVGKIGKSGARYFITIEIAIEGINNLRMVSK